MTLQSKTDMWLEKVESPVAGSVEIHSIVIVISPISLRVAAASVSADPTPAP